MFRDLDALRMAGVPVEFDPARERYHVAPGHLLPATNFTPDEALALIVLCHELGDRRNLPFFDAARRAAVKLQASLPARLHDALRRAAESVQIHLPQTNPLLAKSPIYQQLLGALADRRAVRIRYRRPGETEVLQTKVLPYRMLFSRRSWYLIGRSSIHRATRTFNVGRILDLAVLDDAYRIPRGFSIDRYLRNAWHLIPEPGPDREVTVRFAPRVAENVAEVTWHKTQRLQMLPDGSLDYHVTVSGLREISWWILGYGDQAEVLKPPELRRIVAGHVGRLAEVYAGEKEGWGIGDSGLETGGC